MRDKLTYSLVFEDARLRNLAVSDEKLYETLAFLQRPNRRPYSDFAAVHEASLKMEINEELNRRGRLREAARRLGKPAPEFPEPEMLQRLAELQAQIKTALRGEAE